MRRRKPVCTWATAVPALMQDQLPYLARHGIAAASIDTSQSREHTQDVMAKARAGTLKILMISVERFDSDAVDVVCTGFYRPNLNLLVEPVSGDDKLHRLTQWLTPRAQQSGIVYVTLQKTVQEIGRAGRDGLPSDCLALFNDEGLEVLEAFIYGDTPQSGELPETKGDHLY